MSPYMSIRIAIVALGVTFAVRAALSFASDAVVQTLFCLPPGRVAAFYYGVPLDVETVTFTVRGVSMEVTRACAALDYFSLVCGLLVARIVSAAELPRVARVVEGAAVVPLAYVVTIAANSLRLVALAPIDAALPRSAVPVVHLVAGASVFLGVFIFLYWLLRFNPNRPTEKNK